MTRITPILTHTPVHTGFHEAMGDTIALSVSTPTHMEELGLLPEGADDPGTDLHFNILGLPSSGCCDNFDSLWFSIVNMAF